MSYNKSILFFFSVILMHTSAGAMKRLREKDPVLFYCSHDNCRFVTSRVCTITEHYHRHNDPNSPVCTECDFLGASKQSLSNHKRKIHFPYSSQSKPSMESVVKKPIIEKCGYCGREGSDLTQHMKVYHTPTFGKRSYNDSFPLIVPRKKNNSEVVSISSDSDSFGSHYSDSADTE